MAEPKRVVDDSEQTLAADQIRATLFQAKEYWVHSDAERFADLFAKDGEFVREGQHWKGHSAIQTAFQEILEKWAVKHIEIQRTLINGNKVVMDWSWETVDKESGDRLQKQESIAIDFAQEYIQCWREYTSAEEEI